MTHGIRTVVFDLDGTVYQDTTFHRDYLRFLVRGTRYASWEGALLEFADRVFSGQALVMNDYYLIPHLHPLTPEGYFAALEELRCPFLTFEEALSRDDVIYLGDSWAVMTLLGDTLGLLEGARRNEVFRQTRRVMEERGMGGSIALKLAIQELSSVCEVILLSNSPEDTALQFLRQLGYDKLFPVLCSSANKPFEMVSKLEGINPEIFARPEAVVSIGDHAFNDLRPIKRKGGRTVWLNPFPNIHKAECDLELRTVDDLAGYLRTLTEQAKIKR